MLKDSLSTKMQRTRHERFHMVRNRVGTKRGPPNLDPPLDPFWTPFWTPSGTPSGPPFGPLLDPLLDPLFTPKISFSEHTVGRTLTVAPSLGSSYCPSICVNFLRTRSNEIRGSRELHDNKHLMTGPKGNSELFFSQRPSMPPEAKPMETLRSRK